MADHATSNERGRHLEERMASYFASHGYEARTNVVLEGRSGGRHEVDVLAEKSDPLTTFRVAVECKAWEQPIEKDVVSKLSYVLSDLGLSKGIIVSLRGWRSGAELAARALGIDLWGPAELDRHLGSGGLAGLQCGPTTRLALGYPFVSSLETADVIFRRQAKGRFGLRVVDELVWLSPAWLPVHVVELGVTSAAVRRRREQLTTTAVANMYEAVAGRYIGRAPAEPPDEVDLGAIAVPGLRRDTHVVAEIRKVVARYRSVSQPSAQERHAAQLAELGVPTPCHAVAVERSHLVHLPMHLAILGGREGERVVAVDGRRGALSERVSAVLTENIGHVRQAFGR